MKSQSNKMQTPDDLSPIPLLWIELLAGLTTLIGLLGLLALASQSTWAAPSTRKPAAGDKKGFESGPKTFSNPFYSPSAKGPGGTQDTEEEDDFDDETISDGIAPPLSPRTGATSPTTGNALGSKEISMGGTSSPAGVLSHSDAPPSVYVNDETGEGSKEVVTDFNFPDADIMDIAKTLGKLTGKNFILDKDVKGRITIISNGPITVGDAWKAFLTALDINGFALIPSGKFVRIARQRDARDKQLKTYTGDFSPDTDALITRLFPLKYLSAEEVARNFRSFMPANSRIIPYDQTNTVIVTDTGSNIAKLSKLLDILDVEGYDAGIEVIPVKYASAVELSKLIDTLVPGTTSGGAAGGAPRFGGGRFAARRTKEGGIINTIIADERTNTLIVHANNKGADQIRTLVTKLDQKLPSVTGGGKVHVVYLQFAESEQIANTLNNLSSQAAQRAAGPAGGTGINPVQASLFEGSIKVSPDKATNSLVITASPADFATVQRVINRLDIPRDQVFAEVVIMEITLAKDFNFSTNFAKPNIGLGFTPNTDLIDFIQSPIGSKGAILGFASQDKTSLKIGGQPFDVPNVLALIKTLQTKSNANILATPQIMVLDNTEATFETAERIPVLTSTAVQGAVTQSTTKENVSLLISIKPQINKVTNFVKLDINAKLEDISARELPAQVQNLALATVQRNAKTSIVVADSDTVVLGGLMRDTSQEQISKIPILGDIPLLGWLFRAKKQQSAKTNMLIFITPHIIRQYESVRAVLDKKLKERDEFLESHTGGDDPLRKYRDKMIQSLPDMNEILAAKPEKTFLLDEDAPAAVPVEEKRPSQITPAPLPAPMPQPQPVPALPPVSPPVLVPQVTPQPETAPLPPVPAPAPIPAPLPTEGVKPQS